MVMQEIIYNSLLEAFFLKKKQESCACDHHYLLRLQALHKEEGNKEGREPRGGREPCLPAVSTCWGW